jgi:ribosomal protein S18 acetylase RimI-like enzyme
MNERPRFIIEPLDPAKHRREEFDCGVPALNDYLKTRARKEMDAGVAVCFVAVPENDPEKIAGFYTLSAAAIRRVDLVDDKLLKKLPRYRDFPATLLGRLARSLDFKGCGLGDRLMVSALERANSSSLEVASWAMVTDPMDDQAAGFYTGFGFRFLTETRMFLTMAQIRALLGSNAP